MAYLELHVISCTKIVENKDPLDLGHQTAKKLTTGNSMTS